MLLEANGYDVSLIWCVMYNLVMYSIIISIDRFSGRIDLQEEQHNFPHTYFMLFVFN